MRVSLKRFEVTPRLLSALVVAVALVGCATGCAKKSERIAGQKVILAPAEAPVRTAHPKSHSISVWGVATDDKINASGAGRARLSTMARGYALQMLVFLYGSEAINSQSSFSLKSRGTFSSAGSSIKDESLISHDNISAMILRMEWEGPEYLPEEPALASIATLTPVFDSSEVKKKSFQLRFYAELNGKIRDKMNSLGLKRCLVYLNSMAYDEKAGIHAEFSLFKSNSL